MIPRETTRQFFFGSQPATIYTLITTIVNYVKGEIEINDTILFKIKVILTELLTNSIKHAGGNSALIDIVIKEGYLVIIKADNGDPFAFNCGSDVLTLPLRYNDYADTVFDLYGDTTCALKCKLISERRVTFFVEEKKSTGDDDEFKKYLAEHYGLIIIARAADIFEYEFEYSTNKFMVSIKING